MNKIKSVFIGIVLAFTQFFAVMPAATVATTAVGIVAATASQEAIAQQQQCPPGSSPAPIIMGRGYQGGAPCWGQQPSQGIQWVQGGGQQIVHQGMVLNQPFVPVFGQQGIFTSAGNTYHCPALASWGGGLLGAILGNEIGKKIKVGDGRWSAVGAVAGGFAGHDIACELVGQKTLVQQRQNANPQPSQQGQSARFIRGEQELVGYECDYKDGRPKIMVKQKSDCAAFATRTEIASAVPVSTELRPTAPQPPVEKLKSGNIRFKNPVTGEMIHGMVSSREEATEWIKKQQELCTKELRAQPGSNPDATCGEPGKTS